MVILGFVTLVFLTGVSNQQLNCNVNKVQINSNVIPRVILLYQCYSPTIDNPGFPIGFSQQSEYNEVSLSPNTFTVIPLSSICLYRNIYLLDMSYNKLTTLGSTFKNLNCLPYLKTLIFSNNLISTTISNSDFDDTFSQQLEYIDLSYNQIQSIDEDVFIRLSDSSSRFLNLKYLNLANNRIKEFNLLFPLTIPNSNLNLSISSNPINKLTNNLNLKYNDNRYAYPMVGNRNFDMTNNILENLDDSNLLQYGLTSSNDLLQLLNKIANYDLRQLNIQRVNCQCSNNIASWYQSLLNSNSLNLNSKIIQFKCNYTGYSVFVVDPSCQTIPTTTANQTVADVGFLVSSSTSSYYAFFVLLIIPIILILVVLFWMRPINKCMFQKYKTTCCNSCRPAEDEEYKYDATIICSDTDTACVDRRLTKNVFKEYFRLNFIILASGLRQFTKSEIDEITFSKRVILIVSKHFYNEIWKNLMVRNKIKEIFASDFDCCFIAIQMDDISDNVFKEFINDLEDYRDDLSSCYNCSQRVKYSVGLRNAEKLKLIDENFESNLRFLMPFNKVNVIDQKPVEITISEYDNSIKESKPIIVTKPITVIRQKPNRVEPYQKQSTRATDIDLARNSPLPYRKTFSNDLTQSSGSISINLPNTRQKYPHYVELPPIYYPENESNNIDTSIKRHYIFNESSKQKENENKVLNIDSNVLNKVPVIHAETHQNINPEYLTDYRNSSSKRSHKTKRNNSSKKSKPVKYLGHIEKDHGYNVYDDVNVTFVSLNEKMGPKLALANPVNIKYH